MDTHDDAEVAPHDDLPGPHDDAEVAPHDGADAAPTHARPRQGRRRTLWIGLAVAVVLVAAVVVAVVLTQRGEPVAAPTTPPPVTITNPLPTPVGTPAEREKETPLQQALPDAVLQWTVASQERTTLAADPLESYRLTYTDGVGGTVTVDVVQTRTVEDAVAASTQPAEGAEAPSAGSTVVELPVRAGTVEVGTASVATGGEVGLATWTNGTTAFRATGPGDAIENFFLAFPL